MHSQRSGPSTRWWCSNRMLWHFRLSITCSILRLCTMEFSHHRFQMVCLAWPSRRPSKQKYQRQSQRSLLQMFVRALRLHIASLAAVAPEKIAGSCTQTVGRLTREREMTVTPVQLAVSFFLLNQSLIGPSYHGNTTGREFLWPGSV